MCSVVWVVVGTLTFVLVTSSGKFEMRTLFLVLALMAFSDWGSVSVKIKIEHYYTSSMALKAGCALQ
jgi:hypothetical protein